MKKYLVIALSVGGLNQVHHSGETVTQGHFTDGHADDLVKQGFLKPIDEEDALTEEEKDEALKKAEAEKKAAEEQALLDQMQKEQEEKDEALKKAEAEKKAKKA